MSDTATHEEHVAEQQRHLDAARQQMRDAAGQIRANLDENPSIFAPATRLIGLCGYARSGKDSVGQILADEQGFRQESFAQALKNVAAEINPRLQEPYTGLIPGATLPLSRFFLRYGDWDAVKEQVPAAREFLQNLGVACRDQIGKDVWVTALANRLASAGYPPRVVVTDCRFFNETSWIKGQGGELWRVTRPGNGPANGHISESELPESGPLYDRIITNDGSLADLRKKVLNSGN